MVMYLGLLDNLRAIQISARARSEEASVSHRQFLEMAREADEEFMKKENLPGAGQGAADFEVALGAGKIHVQVSDIAISLIRVIRSLISRGRLVQAVEHHLLHDLREWYSRSVADFKDAPHIAIDRSGFFVKTGDIRFPTMA